ncbi:outer membrane beta-barrel protein [bacterium]|nr:outer membrane beta-barrel protein [bacterium]
MRKWNWLKGLRCLAGIGATMLISGVAVADDAANAAAEQVFKQTSYNLMEEVGCTPKCGADGACAPGCQSDGCNGGGDGCADMFGLCCNQDEFKLFDGVDVGGWAQVGYSSAPTAFNNGPQTGTFLLNQGWLYLDKAAESENGEWAWGYHADFIYGADGANTNAFGNNPGQFDLDPGFNAGARADWAIPQLYAEISNGDWTIKGGHFYTLHGYEVVQATGNFFFTHAYTMNYGEAFTHTGVLVTHNLNDDTQIYAGWTAGFDTGFDQRNGGSNFMGGYSTALTDDITLTQIISAGNFGLNFAPPSGLGPGNQRGSFTMSTVVDYQINDKWNYVFHSDVLRTGIFDTFGINQYLFYQVSDCVKAGTRMEWWKADGASYNAWTVGLNIKPHANVTIRPEYRYDWSPAGNTNRGIQLGLVDQSQGTFAMDFVVTF